MVDLEQMIGAAAHQVASRTLDTLSTQRKHVVICLSGSHAYGFPSPDSDLDLKAVHIAPTEKLLGLGSAEPVADLLQTIEGVEIDYTSNEIGGVLTGLLAGNGNYLERVFGALVVRSSALHESLRAQLPGVLSRRFAHHYRGFASGQLKAVERAALPTAKKVLYVML